MGTTNTISQVELSYLSEIERFSIRSSKPFNAVVTALESAIGHPDMGEFSKAIRNSQTFAEVENTIHLNLGRTGLMLFAKFDLGAVLREMYNLTLFLNVTKKRQNFLVCQATVEHPFIYQLFI
jgi:hypothetical protein